jgi:hypothetical protein
MGQSFAILSAIFAVTTPGVFENGLGIATTLCGRSQQQLILDDRSQALNQWALPTSDFSIVCNRETPIHCEERQGLMTYSLISTFGQYINSKYEVPALGFNALDTPGTVMVGMGGLFPHGVCRGLGERLTITAFMSSQTLRESTGIVRHDEIMKYFRSCPVSLVVYDSLFSYAI